MFRKGWYLCSPTTATPTTIATPYTSSFNCTLWHIHLSLLFFIKCRLTEPIKSSDLLKIRYTVISTVVGKDKKENACVCTCYCVCEHPTVLPAYIVSQVPVSCFCLLLSGLSQLAVVQIHLQEYRHTSRGFIWHTTTTMYNTCTFPEWKACVDGEVFRSYLELQNVCDWYDLTVNIIFILNL